MATRSADADALLSSAERIRGLVRSLKVDAIARGDRATVVLLDTLRDEAAHIERLVAMGVGR